MISEVFPRAWDEFVAFRGAQSRMIELWSHVLEAGLFEEAVTSQPNGHGHISIWTTWPAGEREALTGEMREMLDHLWQCLDYLVIDSISMHSNRFRVTGKAERFFPVAPTIREFNDLLAQGCIDGLRADQAQLIYDCQEFSDPSDEWPLFETVRVGLKQLVEWTHQINSGALVGAWATPVKPQIKVEPPASLSSLTMSPPGPADTSFHVADFVVDNFTEGLPVNGLTGTYMDIAIAPGFEPTGPDDTLSSRARSVSDAILCIAAQFAEWEARTPGIPALSTSVRDPGWKDASFSEHSWSPAELAKLAAQDLPLGLVSEADQQTLIVGTSEGVFERIIKQPSDLNNHLARGIATERATLSAAATWGLPDFVIRPSVETKGSGIREVSDGLIVAGTLGLILQSKSREGTPQAPAREHSWVNKQLRKAVKQLNGTHKRLITAPKEMQNGRGRSVSINGNQMTWAGVIVIDHPDNLNDAELFLPKANIPYVVLTRTDWEFLFDQLKSARAVTEYIHRVETTNEPLDEETLRYYELADADLKTSPKDIDPALLNGAPPSTSPHLPQAPAGFNDPEAFDMLRNILEDVATSDWSTGTETDRLEMLAAIDALIIAKRENIGRFVLTHLETMRNEHQDSPGVRFQSRNVFPIDGGPQLSFAIANRHDDIVEAGLRNWLFLRHSERVDVTDWSTAISVAVLITPRSGSRRRWDTTVAAAKGELGLDDEFLNAARSIWGTRAEVAARQGEADS